MAKDVSNKPASNTNSGNTSPSISDQQKVPPLRIVLNTAGNQKSSSSSISVSTVNQQQELKRDKPQDARTDTTLKTTGGRVRIKLGTNKQVSKGNSSSNDQPPNKTQTDDAQKLKSNIVERQDNSSLKEDIAANYSHLRRITRRSQRSVQTVSNEDEESISSMTSTDENQNTTNNNNSDNGAQDTATVGSNQPASLVATSTATGTNNSSSNAETPRRYKRKRGELSESQLGEPDGAFGYQNYKLPNQNSFELYKNIRKQVDKKLKNLSSIHTRAPHGFRDYMITRGAYLLDGNKLGNGTNLFMNEDGGLHSAPLGKYHALRHKTNYSVPNRAKVPLGLPVNSPLYNLFIDQEKERYRMRMQHIKEREKLTLAAEQEIVRVYNQAAMAAANQLEPFSACTMLKHQEIYNYMDADGFTILSSDDAHQDQAKQDGVRTRRRNQPQHEPISPPSTRKNSSTEEPAPTLDVLQKDTKPQEHTSVPAEDPTNKKEDSDESNQADKTDIITTEISIKKKEAGTIDSEFESSTESKDEAPQLKSETETAGKSVDAQPADTKSATDQTNSLKESEKTDKAPERPNELDDNQNNSDDPRPKALDGRDKTSDITQVESNAKEASDVAPTEEESKEISLKGDVARNSEEKDENQGLIDSKKDSGPTDTPTIAGDDGGRAVLMEHEADEQQAGSNINSEPMLTDDDMRAYNKSVFLSQLQVIDDKWDKVRNEMLIRHKNEAESLYAVQKLEWEWKTKEIGACDVRMTPVIDNTLVPRLNIYSQDY